MKFDENLLLAHSMAFIYAAHITSLASCGIKY